MREGTVIVVVAVVGCIKIIFNFTNLYSYFNQLIGLVGRVFVNSPGYLGSIPGHIIPKTLKMVLDTSLLNTQRYKVHIKGKVALSPTP